MKAIPVVTAFLMGNIIYAKYGIRKLSAWHGSLYQLQSVPRDVIDIHSRALEHWGWNVLAAQVVCLSLLVIIWNKKLCDRRLWIALLVLWMLTWILPLSIP